MQFEIRMLEQAPYFFVIGAVVVGGAALGYYWRKIRRKVSKPGETEAGVSVEEQLSDLEDED